LLNALDGRQGRPSFTATRCGKNERDENEMQ